MPKMSMSAPHTPNTTSCTSGVHRCFVLNTVNEVSVYHARSQLQCTTANTTTTMGPNHWALNTRSAPTVAHQMKKYGLAEVVIAPARVAPYGIEPLPPSALAFLA